MNLARRLNAGVTRHHKVPSVALATAEYRVDSSVANATLRFRKRAFPGFEKPA